MEVSYPDYDSTLTDNQRHAGASVAVADYDSRGRIIQAWMPENVAVNPTSGAITTSSTDYTTWTYTDFGGTESGGPAPSPNPGPSPSPAPASVSGLARTDVTTYADVPGFGEASYVTSTWTEPQRGLTTMSADANGLYTHYRYDAFGLLTEGYAPKVDRHGPEVPWEDSEYHVPDAIFAYDVYPSSPRVRVTPVVVYTARVSGYDTSGPEWACVEAGCYVNRSYVFLDGFGRAFEQHRVSPGGDGGRIVTATRYDDWGRVAWASAPFYQSTDATADSDPASPVVLALEKVTVPTYDWAGRVVAQTVAFDDDANPATATIDTTTSTAYFGNVTQVEAASGAVTETVNDVRGRLIRQSRHPESGYDTDSSFDTTYAYATDTGGDWATTYGAANSLAGFTKVTVTDPDDNDTVSVANLVGQRVVLDDPNAGESTFIHDRDGNTTGVLSEAGYTGMTLDGFGRMTARDTYELDGNGDPDTNAPSSSASWDYNDGEESTLPLGALLQTVATTQVPGGGRLPGGDDHRRVRRVGPSDAVDGAVAAGHHQFGSGLCGRREPVG